MSTAARLMRSARDTCLRAGVERNMRSPPGAYTGECELEGSKGYFYRSGTSFETHRTEGQ